MRLLVLFVLCAIPIAAIWSAPPGQSSFKLVSSEREENFRGMLPKTADPDFEALKKKSLVFYTEEDIPPAYQRWNEGVRSPRDPGTTMGLHSVYYNISGNPEEKRIGYGNANREFPWGSPAGLHLSDNASNFKFVYLPDAISVKRELLPKPSSKDDLPAYVWTYPEGTVFGEVLGVTDSEGYSYTFEVRTRTKGKGAWIPNVYRPFPAHKDLTAAVTKLIESNPEWKSYGESIQKPVSKPVKKRLSDADNPNPRLRHPTKQVVNVEATEWELGALPQLMVQKLLKRTEFRKDFGEAWLDGEHYAVTTQTDFNIVPRNYKGGYFQANKGSCATCHETTLKHADDFDFSRDWYARVRGSDNIFSFHPFALSSIAPNGNGVPVQYRAELLDAGLINETK